MNRKPDPANVGSAFSLLNEMEETEAFHYFKDSSKSFDGENDSKLF